MDAFAGLSGLFGERGTATANVLNLKPLTSAQQTHLQRVYTLLAAGIVASGLGVYLDMFWFHIPVFLAVIVHIGCVMYISSTRYVATTDKDQQRRVLAFVALAIASGMTLGQLISMTNYVNPAILPTAFFGTLAIFTCFSLSAIFASSRSMLFLGGGLASISGMLAWMSLGNIFLRSRMLMSAQIWIGLVVLIGYILYDTQLVLEEVLVGRADYVMHALQFYVDLVGLFVRLIYILLEKEEKKQAKEEKNRKRA